MIREILAFFVTIFSFVPILFLGFDVLYWVLRLWQVIIAIVWATLMLMVTKALRRTTHSKLDV